MVLELASQRLERSLLAVNLSSNLWDGFEARPEFGHYISGCLSEII